MNDATVEGQRSMAIVGPSPFIDHTLGSQTEGVLPPIRRGRSFQVYVCADQGIKPFSPHYTK
jgi:hypothetical protein